MNFSSSSSRPLQLKQLDENTVDFLSRLSRVRRRWSRQRRSVGDSLRAMCVEKASALPLLTIPASDSLSAVVEAYTRWLVVDCDSKPVYMTWTSRSKAMGTSQGGKLIRPLMSPSKSNCSMTPSCNDNEEEDFYLLRRAERRLLRLFYLSHKTAELETGSLILPIDRLPAALSLLSLLSRDQAFLHKPLTLPNGEVTMPWLLGTSVFSAAQFIASQLEVQLQHLGIGGDKGSTPSSAAFDQAKSKNALVSSQLLSGLAGTDASPLRKDRLLESAMLGGLKNTLKSSDAEKLKCILSVSYKRYTDFFPLKKMSSYHETMHRLFMLTYTLSQPPVYNDGSTVRCTIFPSIKPLSSVTMAPLMGTPLEHAFSSLQELSFDIFKRIYERSVSVYLSKLWIEGTEAKGKVSKPLSKQKKKKKKSSNLKSHASQREEVVHNNTKSLLHSSSLSLNLGIAPASVTRKEQEATERVVLVTQIIEDVINIALSLVHEVCLAPKSPAIPEKGSTLGCLERLPSKTTSAYAQAHAESSPTSSPIPPTLALDERAGLYENTDIFYSNDPVFNSVPAAPQTSTGNYYHYWQPQQQQEEFRTSFMLPLPDTTLVSFADLSSSSPLEDRHNIFNGFWDGSSVSERQMSVGGGFEDEPEADDADYGPFTTAALRAHTVYHESLLKEETMKRSGFAVGNRSEGFVAAAVTSSKMRNSLGATPRQRGRSMFAPSTGKEKHRRYANSTVHSILGRNEGR